MCNAKSVKLYVKSVFILKEHFTKSLVLTLGLFLYDIFPFIIELRSHIFIRIMETWCQILVS